MQRSGLLWDRRFDARIVDLCTIGLGAVVATEQATYGIAPATGQISWTAPAAERLECSPDGALLISEQSLTLVDTVGQVAIATSGPSALIELEVSSVAPAPRGAIWCCPTR